MNETFTVVSGAHDQGDEDDGGVRPRRRLNNLRARRALSSIVLQQKFKKDIRLAPRSVRAEQVRPGRQ